ncbi:hypothetical protein [Vannielia litorea]|uniref:hypothetical protein n=1 Tax=Vannielia litorea TaxID=1217970 RepID=UPI001C942658|nr:hypothetical protein [Vannielia litorea]MBY6047550.1 hypothetical protein [Vannielia litorea]MBY6074964.1 hypothetical protein [Vannielia litorea]
MPLPAKVDAALLYAAVPNPDFAAIAERVNAIMAPAGIALQTTTMKPGQGAKLESQGLSLTIAMAGKRLTETRLAKAMASDYTRLTGLDGPAEVAAHHAFVAVVAEAKGFDAGSQDTFETLLALTQIATSHIAMEAEPLAIHWGQSDQLFSPERFLAMADVLFPLPLFCHARPFSSGRVAEGTQCIGFRLERADQVLGRPLLFREAPARLPYLLDRAYAFIDHCRENGRILGDGAQFGASPGEVIAVAMKPPSEEYPQGHIELTLREREGVFQLQPDGAYNPEGMAEAAPETAPAGPLPPAGKTGNAVDDFFSTPDSAARERIGQAATAGVMRPNAMGGLAGTASDALGGIDALRAASKDRMDREKRKSEAHVKQMQWVGFLFGAGIPGWQTAATSPGLQKALPWLAIAAVAMVHPIAAALMLVLHLLRPMPYYVYGGLACLVVFGAVLTGASPQLGYMDLISLVMGGEVSLVSGSAYEPTNLVERDYYESYGEPRSGWSALLGGIF